MSVVAPVVRELRALWSGDRGRSLAVISVAWGLLIGTRMVYPVLLPYLRSSFDLTLTVAGLLVTVLWFGSAIGQLPGGILADRYGERVVMSASPLCVAVALALLVVAPTAVALFAATALVGLSQSLYPVARITMLSDIYPERVGSALGVTMATGDLGQTMLPPVAGALAAAVAWQAGFGYVIPLFLFAGPALWLVLPRPDRPAGTGETFSGDAVRRLGAELRHTDMLFMVGILFLYILVWQSFTGLYPTYLAEEKGLSSATVGVLFGLFFAMGVVVKPAAGGAYDRLGVRRSLVLVLVGPVVGFALLPFLDAVWQLAVVTVLVSTMLGSGAITQSFLAESFSEELRGTGLGSIRTATATLGALGPVVFGAVADRGYFDEGYLALAAVMMVVVLLAFRLREPDGGRA